MPRGAVVVAKHSDVGDVRHAVPRVPRPVVPALPHAVREEVAFDHIPTPEAVVEVESGARPVEMDVAGKIRGRRGRLEPHRRLLLPYPDLVDKVVGDAGAAGLVAAAAVGSDGVRDLLGAVGVEAVPRGPPRGHRAVSNPRHFIVIDLCAAVVVGEEDQHFLECKRISPNKREIINNLKRYTKGISIIMKCFNNCFILI